jgi:hypothetical protein
MNARGNSNYNSSIANRKCSSNNNIRRQEGKRERSRRRNNPNHSDAV